MARYFAQSMGRRRKPLKTTIISAADVKADRSVVRMAIAAAKIVVPAMDTPDNHRRLGEIRAGELELVPQKERKRYDENRKEESLR